MRWFARIYVASALFVLALFLIFAFPIDELPIGRPTTAIVVGALILAVAVPYVFRIYRREGLELGWFLSHRGGLWVIGLGLFGLFLVVCGMLFLAAPHAVEPAFEKGAWPVAGLIAILFWLALIYMFGLMTVSVTGRTVAIFRTKQFLRGIFNIALCALTAALTALFCSGLIAVIDENVLRLAESFQWRLIWISASIFVATGIVYGIRQPPAELLGNEEMKREPS